MPWACARVVGTGRTTAQWRARWRSRHGRAALLARRPGANASRSHGRRTRTLARRHLSERAHLSERVVGAAAGAAARFDSSGLQAFYPTTRHCALFAKVRPPRALRVRGT